MQKAVGVKSTTGYYLATSASSGVQFSKSTFSTQMQTLTLTNCYLWFCIATEYTDGTVDYTTPVIVGMYGNDRYVYRPRGRIVANPDDPYIYNESVRDYGLFEINNGVYVFRVRKINTSITAVPTSSSGDSNWEVASNLGFCASDLILSTYALIKNLGAEAIEMKDTDGNVIFSAKDGVVTCNTGNFNNVNVESGVVGGLKLKENLLVSKNWWNSDTLEDLLYLGDSGDFACRCFGNINGNVFIGKSAVSPYKAINGKNTELVDTGVNSAETIEAKDNSNSQPNTNSLWWLKGRENSYKKDFCALAINCLNGGFGAINNGMLATGRLVLKPTIIGELTSSSSTLRYVLDDTDNISTPSTAYTLTSEGVVFVKRSAVTYIKMPSNPQAGSEIKIIQGGTGIIYFMPNGKSFCHGSETTTGNAKSGTNGQINFFYFDGTYWNCNYTNKDRMW